ncbi:MAG: Hint domain-containing protein [Pseudomonadota bacterium]
MSGYISEYKYYGTSDQEFVEVAIPAGTDVSGYSLAFYMSNGQQYASYGLGNYQATMNGHDVYVLDDSVPGFSTSDEMGNFYPDDAIALIDDSGNVVQFISWEGNTVTATDGPASGETSADTGSISSVGQSMQSDNGGSTYYAQSSSNAGAIPACYATGTLLQTPNGTRRIERLRPGDEVLSADGTKHLIKWVWKGTQPLGLVPRHEKPVLIKKGALGPALPAQDLIVSGQHRMVAGAPDILDHAFSTPCFVPAKALTALPGVRYMTGKRSITWHHILCDDHVVIAANGALSETLLLGPEILQSLSVQQRRDIGGALRRKLRPSTQMTPALPCQPVQQAISTLKHTRRYLKPRLEMAA